MIQCLPKKVLKLTNFSLVNAIYTRSLGKKFDLNSSTLLVLIGLANHFNPNKNIVFPSQEYLANNLNVSERSVIRAIKELLKKNLIIKTKNGASNVYCFTNIFFEMTQLSGNGCQNVINKGDKMSVKHDNHDMKSNIVNLQKNDGDKRIEETRRLLKQQNDVKLGSPLDYSYEEAKQFLDNLIPELRNSYFAIELKKKWNL